MNIIKSIFNDNEINIISRKIFYSNNNIYLAYSKKISIGKLNEALLFIPKYIIIYDSNKILKSEKNYLLENTIKNYINELKCDINNPNLQILKDKKRNIGQLIVLNEAESRDNSYNINNNKKQDKLIINDSQENYSENYEENKKLKEEEKYENEDYKLKGNELIYSNMKLQKQKNDLEKSINNYEEINNKLREKENIINEYENNFLKLKDELSKKDDKLKDYLNIQKELENKENEIIIINKKLEDNQNYINELENKDREKENQIKN